MSTMLEIACENLEELLDTHPSLARTEVFWGSELFPHLLYPHLYFDAYEGAEGGPFGFVKNSFGVRCILQDVLLEGDKKLVKGAEFTANMETLKRVLDAHQASIPSIYSVMKSTGESFDTLKIGDKLRLECGYDYCSLIDDVAEKALDLRKEQEIVIGNSQFTIQRTDTVALLQPEIERIMTVGHTAVRYGCAIELHVY